MLNFRRLSLIQSIDLYLAHGRGYASVADMAAVAEELTGRPCAASREGLVGARQALVEQQAAGGAQ